MPLTHPRIDAKDMAPAKRPLNVLFLCTGNSARSIMAESILRREGAGRIDAFSAGSHPTGGVNPHAIDVLQAAGFPTDGLRSKAWDAFAAPNAAPLDVVITVWDDARGEACPVWPGHPPPAHWGMPDPAAVDRSEGEQRAAFERAFRLLSARIRLFTRLPLDTLDAASLAARLHAIGETT
jgi:arsenate reductase